MLTEITISTKLLCVASSSSSAEDYLYHLEFIFIIGGIDSQTNKFVALKTFANFNNSDS